MNKGYFAVWFDLGDGEFQATSLYNTLKGLKKDVDFFADDPASGHVVILHSNGKTVCPVEEAWMPEQKPQLNWRKFQ